MSGGGSYGAFEAGVLHGFLHSNSSDNFNWDVVTGVSAGSINTAAVSLWKPEDTLDMVSWLSDTWASISTDDVYNNWFPGGIVSGVLKHSSLFNTQVGFHTLYNIFDAVGNTLYRKMVVTCVDVNTGSVISFDETVDDPVKAIMSSSSIPFIFPTTTWKDYKG